MRPCSQIETAPVSSETTTQTASVDSVMPTAARWRVPTSGARSWFSLSGSVIGGYGGGLAADSGRIYVATGQSADVFSPKGEFLGSIPGPKGMHGVFIAGKDKKTLYGIVFYGGWGTPSARNSATRCAGPSYGRGGDGGVGSMRFSG